MDVIELTIKEEENVLDAMKQLDRVATKVLFVTRDNKLVAALTDGDIRRWIMSGGKLESTINHVANYHPKYLVNATKNQALDFMQVNQLDAMPILDENDYINNVVLDDGRTIKKKNSFVRIPVVMMAGGKGTRLYPYTNILPKPLIPVGDIPIAERIINSFREYGCQDFHLIVNHKKNMIKAYFNEIARGYNVFYVDEDIPLGTGGGLSLLKGKISEVFFLTNCDILICEDMNKIYKAHKENHNLITMVCSLKNFSIPYGVVEIGEEGEIASMREKPELSFFTNTGCYVVEPDVIEELEENKPIGFPDIIEKYKKQGKRIGVFPIGENAWMDMGQLDELEKMRDRLSQH